MDRTDKKFKNTPDERSMLFLHHNLAFLRRQLGRTQAELADFLNMQRSAWGAYEANNAKPAVEKLAKIYHYFKEEFKAINMDELLFEDMEKKYKNNTAELILGQKSEVDEEDISLFIDMDFVSVVNEQLEKYFITKLERQITDNLHNKCNELISKCWDLLLDKELKSMNKGKIKVKLMIFANREVSDILKNKTND